MADDTYMNPFQPNPTGGGPYNGFALGVESARRNFELAPFKRMEQQRQEMGLQKQQQQQNEFMSPEAIQSRTSAYPATTAENQLKTQTAQSTMELEPIQHQQKVEEARQLLAKTKGHPAGLLLEELGNSAGVLSKAPAGMKPQLYNSLVKGIEAKYPGMQFPDEWKQYHQGVEDHLGALHEAAINTPKFGQEQRLETIKGQAHVAGSQATAAGQIGRGEAQARGTVEAAAIRGPGGQFRELEGYRKILNSKKATPEQKAEAHGSLEMAVEPLIDDKIMKAWGNEANAQMTIGNDEAKLKAREQGIAKMRKDMRIHYGVDVRMTDTQGKTRIVSRRDMDDAIKAGYKLVK